MATPSSPATEATLVESEVDAPSGTGQYSAEQIQNAITNYCYSTHSEIAEAEANGYSVGFDAQGYVGDEYVVVFYSYTRARVYYHVNIYTGDVRTTEFVPGIMTEEMPGSESFNIANYL